MAGGYRCRKQFPIYGNRKEINMLYLEKGQGIVEYALILVLIAIVVIGILIILGPIIGNIFSTIVNSI